MNPGWPASLQCGDVGVRPLGRRDVTAWSRVRADNIDWLTPWDATLPPGAGQSPGSYFSMLSTLRRKAREGSMMPFALLWRRSLVGQITVGSITRGSAQSASIGYWIDRTHAGHGVMPTAVAMVTDHLFTAAHLHRVDIAIRPENTASLRVVEKLGFVEVGLAPSYLHIAGRWCDHRLFQLTAEDVPEGVLRRWLARRG